MAGHNGQDLATRRPARLDPRRAVLKDKHPLVVAVQVELLTPEAVAGWVRLTVGYRLGRDEVFRGGEVEDV